MAGVGGGGEGKGGNIVLKEYNCDSESKNLSYWICNVSLRRINSKVVTCALTIFECD